MNCENDDNHDYYCMHCQTCHDCLEEGQEAEAQHLKQLQQENTAYAITVLNLEAGMRDMLRVIETDIRKTGGNSRLEALLEKYANNLEGKQ